MNSGYYGRDYVSGMFNCNFEDQERTIVKGNSKGKWTPNKEGYDMRDTMDNIGNDSTFIDMPTYSKTNIIIQVETPQKAKTNNTFYEASVRTPIKKTKKRDCTPAYSDEKKNSNVFFNTENYHNTFGENMQGMQLKFPNFSNNSKHIGNFDLFRNKQSSYNSMNNNPQFQHLSKSKFLQKIDDTDVETNDKCVESKEIIDKIRGIYLLSILEFESVDLFKLFFDDQDIFNKITNIICFSIFEGFNKRSDTFFKFLSPNVFLEIVDQPLNSFQENLALLNNHILELQPNFQNYQIDILESENKYIFSVNGLSLLNTENKEALNFILSLRINLNFTDIRDEFIRLENIVSIDFIKFKVFSN